MEAHLKLIGLIHIILAFIHLFFPSYFKWKEELKEISLINRQIMMVHTIFIALVIFLIGVLCLNSYNEIIGTKLGKTICFGLSIFWITRLIVQFFGYSSELWKGKTFETTIHIVFSILWTYLSIVFVWIALY